MDNKKKKNSAASFLWPYILIIGIIVIAVLSYTRGIRNKKVAFNSYDDMKVALTEPNVKVQSIAVSEKETVIDIEGVYTIDGEKVNYYFTSTLPIVENDAFDGCKADIYTLVYSFKDADTNKSIAEIQYAFKKSVWGTLLVYVLPTAIMIVLMIVFMNKLGGKGGSDLNKSLDFGKSRARNIQNCKTKFADVAGCDEEKAEMAELVDYLKNPKKFAAMGARIPKGVILTGNPGTGKTLLAKAVAGEANVPFLSISGSDFVEMFVGVGASRVRDMFAKAKQNAPCIVFIDEIDAVGRQRGAGLGGGNDEREQTLNQLLVEMDGFADNSGIIVVAATNRPDVLDPALLRPGRFDRQITVSLPDKSGREAILKVHARNKKMAEGLDFEAIAKRTPGFSGGELENVLNEAAILAVRLNHEAITIEDIDEAIDRVMGGPAKKSKTFTAKEKRMVAFHEAGHTIIGLKLASANKVQKVTIVPRGDAGGYVLMTPTDDRFLMTKSELIEEITGLLGGRASEEIFFGDVTSGAQNDIEKATKIARVMVTNLGMSPLGPIQYEQPQGSVFLGRDYTNASRNYSGEVAYEIDKEIKNIMNEAMENARKIVEENKEKVTLIAETLLDEETLTYEEVMQLMESGKLTETVVAPVEEVKTEEAVVEEQPVQQEENHE